MLLFFLRHGDPIYDPDDLTPLGRRQAEALAKRLSQYGLNKIYASTSNRAIRTAEPTCEILKQDMTLLDWCSEKYAWEQLTFKNNAGHTMWMFQDDEFIKLFVSEEIRKLDKNWYEHPAFENLQVKEGILRVQRETDAFFALLGYEHDRENNVYYSNAENNDRIAIFAHQGFGLAFLSSILDIPYPQFCTHFDSGHSGMTVIEFPAKKGIVVPKMLQLSNDSHLYKEGLPTYYQNNIRF